MAATLTASQLAVAKDICGFLMSPPASLNLPPSVAKGLPANSAYAVCGNAAQESSFNPTIPGDGGVSYGLWQFGGSRLVSSPAATPAGLKTWCEENGLGYTSVRGQSYFFLYDLANANGAPQIVPWLMDRSNNGQPARSIETLTADIVQFDERAGKPELDNRISYAKQVAAYMSTQPQPMMPAPPPVAVVTPPPIPPTTGAFTMDPTLIAALTQFAPVIESFVAGIFRGAGTALAPALPAIVSQLTGAATVPNAATPPPAIDLNALAASLAPLINAQIQTELPALISAALAKLTPAK